jgi:hypothetical protein
VSRTGEFQLSVNTTAEARAAAEMSEHLTAAQALAQAARRRATAAENQRYEAARQAPRRG